MADLPAGIGYITVSAKGVLAGTDSNDAGSVPDAIPLSASVVISPSISRPIASTLGDNTVIALGRINCTLDSSGILRPPGDDTGEVRLIAPQQDSITIRDWTWKASFTPTLGTSQSWAAFDITFTGAPGEIVVLADVLAANAVTSVPSSTLEQVVLHAAAEAKTARDEAVAAANGSVDFSQGLTVPVLEHDESIPDTATPNSVWFRKPAP